MGRWGNGLSTTARVKSLREILEKKKYGIDSFQREYKWENRQIEELIDDLEAKFNMQYKEGDAQERVKEYTEYYMGTIIISNSKQGNFIVDGQQRLTSITLLLIYLNSLQESIPPDDREEIDSMISSKVFGERSYNLEIEDRVRCMDAIYKGKEFTPDRESEINIIRAYDDIKERSEFKPGNKKLLHFISWLSEKVQFVEITMPTSDDAYSIFETMNDRGLSLTPTEMLKGYLLTNAGSNHKELNLNEKWNRRIQEIRNANKNLNNNEDSEFFRSWFRAKYAETIRATKKNAKNEDFEIIGTRFHNWVRDNKEKIGLNKERDYQDFLESKFDFYSKLYLQIHGAADVITEGLEHVYYIEKLEVSPSFYYPALMAPVLLDDKESEIIRKMDMVARFLEMFYVYRKINRKTTGHSSIRHAIFGIIKEMRNKDSAELADLLKKKIKNVIDDSGGMNGMGHLGLVTNNKKFIRYILSRITSHVERMSEAKNTFDDYMSKNIKNPYSIEHIISNQFDREKDNFTDKVEFEELRDRLGGLLLLPSDFNKSFGDLPYSEKVGKYDSQNLLARSLNGLCYENNPSFNAYVAKMGHPFRAYPKFGKNEIESRQKLYTKICTEIWNTEKFAV